MDSDKARQSKDPAKMYPGNRKHSAHILASVCWRPTHLVRKKASIPSSTRYRPGMLPLSFPLPALQSFPGYDSREYPDFCNKMKGVHSQILQDVVNGLDSSITCIRSGLELEYNDLWL